MSGEISRKITFSARNIGSRTLVLLLAFNFAPSNVFPLSPRQEQHPVVWKILRFQKTDARVVTYTDRLAFTKAERKQPSAENTDRWILLPPVLIQQVNAKQETMLVETPNKPIIYSFANPIDLTYLSSVAMNGVQSPVGVDLAFGFYETKADTKPAQIICFHQIPSNFPVSLQFVPLLQAYFVPENFYEEGEVLTMPVPTKVFEIDIRSLPTEKNYIVSVDQDTKMAFIADA